MAEEPEICRIHRLNICCYPCKLRCIRPGHRLLQRPFFVCSIGRRARKCRLGHGVVHTDTLRAGMSETESEVWVRASDARFGRTVSAKTNHDPDATKQQSEAQKLAATLLVPCPHLAFRSPPWQDARALSTGCGLAPPPLQPVYALRPSAGL